MDLTQITTFMGWCAVLNISLLLLATLALTLMRDTIMGIHSKMMGIDTSDLPNHYMAYLAQFKVMALVFSLVPYIALKMM